MPVIYAVVYVFGSPLGGVRLLMDGRNVLVDSHEDFLEQPVVSVAASHLLALGLSPRAVPVVCSLEYQHRLGCNVFLLRRPRCHPSCLQLLFLHTMRLVTGKEADHC